MIRACIFMPENVELEIPCGWTDPYKIIVKFNLHRKDTQNYTNKPGPEVIKLFQAQLT